MLDKIRNILPFQQYVCLLVETFFLVLQATDEQYYDLLRACCEQLWCEDASALQHLAAAALHKSELASKLAILST